MLKTKITNNPPLVEQSVQDPFTWPHFPYLQEKPGHIQTAQKLWRKIPKQTAKSSRITTCPLPKSVIHIDNSSSNLSCSTLIRVHIRHLLFFPLTALSLQGNNPARWKGAKNLSVPLKRTLSLVDPQHRDFHGLRVPVWRDRLVQPPENAGEAGGE